MNGFTIEQLKARAFDLIVAMQQGQRELEAIHQEIAKLSKPKEEPKVEA